MTRPFFHHVIPGPWRSASTGGYTPDMGSHLPAFKYIVAAALASVGFSSLSLAQGASEGPAPEAVATEPAEREADLLRQLREAETPEAAAMIEAELVGLWSQSGSAAVDLLLRRGQDALAAGTPDVAVEHFTATIDHAPDFAEAYAGRAAAYYLTNRVGPALDDLRQALALEPQHIGAMQGFGVILEELGRDGDALEIFRRIADMDPQDAEAQAAVDRLALALEGRTL